jgi:hypothetical protein
LTTQFAAHPSSHENEIISFYGDEDKGDLKTLLSLATVSQGVSDVALNRAWNDMISLEPIAHVLNVVAGKKILELVESKSIAENRKWVS